MFFYTEALINEIVPDQPDPSAAKAMQEILGGHYGEMRTMMQFSFQSANFRGPATQYRDLIRGIFLEEISHVELVQTTINKLLDGSGRSDKGENEPLLANAPGDGQTYHYIIGAQSSLPVDSSGNPWNGSWVYDHGNLVSNLLDNLVLEATGTLQKSRIYEMSTNKTFRETLAFLMVRDNAHQNAYAKALETLGVNWGKVLPVPDYDLTQYPECRKYIERGWHNAQFNFRLDPTRIGEIFQGESPGRHGGTLKVEPPPAGFPVPQMPERVSEHSPGIPRELTGAARS
ncbi:Catalase [Paenibacillus mucilaginosus 3016]|uniref:Catalase n=2 Tax=Paenibacillus mucilaginosus TaxID=61624 RepID=H6NHP3_9BACL|nr:manganese catalase family protein [Paenibacillus mucilaginosus]AFC29640.1 Catalase [Paenibacillus mucilaginosus 3016]AFH61816.1 catalase [Paenibacillus mucilaginosus K02]WFA18322.1 manganese catalase family protein [Paenibacillus mucilaginosus]